MKIRIYLIVPILILLHQQILFSQNQLVGYVLDMNNSSNLGGVKVILFDRSMEYITDSSDGKFLFDHSFESAEPLKLGFIKDGYEYKTKEWNYGKDGNMGEIKLEKIKSINHKIEIHVIKRDDRSFVEGYEIHYQDRSFVTDKHGRISLTIRDEYQIEGVKPLVITGKSTGFRDTIITDYFYNKRGVPLILFVHSRNTPPFPLCPKGLGPNFLCGCPNEFNKYVPVIEYTPHTTLEVLGNRHKIQKVEVEEKGDIFDITATSIYENKAPRTVTILKKNLTPIQKSNKTNLTNIYTLNNSDEIIKQKIYCSEEEKEWIDTFSSLPNCIEVSGNQAPDYLLLESISRDGGKLSLLSNSGSVIFYSRHEQLNLWRVVKQENPTSSRNIVYSKDKNFQFIGNDNGRISIYKRKVNFD